MEVIKYILLLLALSKNTQAVELKPVQMVAVKKIFETQISTPNALVACQDKLWTYSVKDRKLFALSVANGEIEKQVDSSEEIQDIACFKNKVYILTAQKKNQKIYELIPKSNQWNRVGLLPTNNWVSRLICSAEKCFALSDDIRSTTDFRIWISESIPRVTALKKADYDPQINPFDDWQSSLNLAQAVYSDLAIDKEGSLAALDSRHTQIAVKNNKGWVKWGKYGFWEGHFLQPKKIIFTNSERLIVADNSLKALFYYTSSGQYLGTLSAEKNYILSHGLITGLVDQDQIIFYSDFIKNKVTAIQLLPLNEEKDVNSNNDQILFKQNLLRHGDVQQDGSSSVCLNCHDGTAVNHLRVFTEKLNKHPISCVACHDSHHSFQNKKNLNKLENDLCFSCHAIKALPDSNHVWNNGKKGGSCLGCHEAHSQNNKLLRASTPQLCINCHKSQSVEHREVKDILSNDRAQGLIFSENKISCQTCHLTHENSKKSAFTFKQDKIQFFCASCHGNKSTEIYKNFHKIINKKAK